MDITYLTNMYDVYCDDKKLEEIMKIEYRVYQPPYRPNAIVIIITSLSDGYLCIHEHQDTDVKFVKKMYSKEEKNETHL